MSYNNSSNDAYLSIGDKTEPLLYKSNPNGNLKVEEED